MTQSIQTLPFETDTGLGARARIGLIVLQTDQTLNMRWARCYAAMALRSITRVSPTRCK